MKDCYNGYQELHLNGLELKKLFKDSFYCTGRHHGTIIALSIPVYLESLNIKNDETYRIFYNENFCKIKKEETDANITFFGHSKSRFSKFFSEDDLHIPKCTLCNSEMKLRNSKYCEFWGCSKYPDCKGKLQISIIKKDY